MVLRHDQHRRTLTPRAGVLDSISDLRTAGYAIGVLTDCTAETPELWPSLPYPAVVDAVAFSCEVGHRKPHPAGYHEVARKLGVAAQECLYVGDGSNAELTGATQVEMTAVLVETPFGTDFRYDAESRGVEIVVNQPNPSGPGHHACGGDELADLRGMLDRVTGEARDDPRVRLASVAMGGRQGCRRPFIGHL